MMAQQFYTDLDLYQHCCPIVEFKDFFKASEWFSSTFQGRFNLQELFKQALQIQVLFKPVWTLIVHNYIGTQYISVCPLPK